MQLRGRKRATAAAVAVIGTLLGGAVADAPPGAFAVAGAPVGPAREPAPAAGRGAAAAPAGAAAPVAVADPAAVADPGAEPVRAAAEGPAVWPRPQSMTADPAREVPLGAEAVLVAPADADPYAVQVVRDALRRAGVRTLHERAPGAPLPEHGTVVRLQGQGAEDALRELGAAGAGDLPDGGYRLAVGRPGGRDTVALAGVGADGLFHAAQTLRQLLAAGGQKVPGVRVRHS
ncbi:glycoside hydrolase family 20 zincin-like fold domain-containing protein, partial [Streptomyces antarcticus]|uniref:glycoside hydrolase family 20 zincin-like fold domain-containing protein n=1 Tax=Streptomyces antarcticus TaxID=2996458 RepID=UPI0022C850E9|nr:hyaluronidase [Streptomyces sp. H34-S5]